MDIDQVHKPKKKSKPKSPTARTLDVCKKAKWTAQVVERFCSFTKRRIDLFGVIDVLAVTGSGIVGIQSTSRDNVSSRVRKIMDEPRVPIWLESGGRLFVHGWGKMASGRWECREVEIVLNDGVLEKIDVDDSIEF